MQSDFFSGNYLEKNFCDLTLAFSIDETRYLEEEVLSQEVHSTDKRTVIPLFPSSSRLIFDTVTNVQPGDSIYLIMPLFGTKKKQDRLSKKTRKNVQNHLGLLLYF